MKRHLNISIFVFTLIAFWATAAVAAEISISSTYTLTVTVSKFDLLSGSPGAAIAPSSGYTQSSASGSAYYPDDSGWGYEEKYGAPPQSTSASGPGTTWIKQNNASMTWSDSQNLTSSHQAVGWAPNSSAPFANDGYISQNVYNYTHMDFEVPESGWYLGTAAGNYTNEVSLQQAAGSSNKFYSLYGYSYFYGEFSFPSGYSFFDKVPFSIDSSNYPYPIPDFTQNTGENVGVGMFAYLNTGDIISFRTQDSSYYHGYAAPLPSTLLLLGGGLAGLLVLNRRRVN